jgi:hypothetical protein
MSTLRDGMFIFTVCGFYGTRYTHTYIIYAQSIEARGGLIKSPEMFLFLLKPSSEGLKFPSVWVLDRMWMFELYMDLRVRARV